MLGKRIKELRERNGIFLDNLAHNSGISIEALNRLEDNEIEHVENHELFAIIDNLHLKSAYDFRCFGESPHRNPCVSSPPDKEIDWFRCEDTPKHLKICN